MSRILNRPMFRGGGKVSSYGTGIASGLADGGRVDFKHGGTHASLTLPEQRSLIAYKKPGAQKYTDTFLEDRLNEYKKNLYTSNIPDLDIAYGMQMIPPMSDEQLAQANYFKETPEDFTKDFYSGEIGGTNYNKLQSDQLAAATLAGEQDLFKLLEKETVKNDTPEVKIETAPQIKKLTDEEKLAEVEKEQAFFEKLLGGGKEAKIQDASEMAISFASKALSEGATVKSAFADFLGDETKRPSRRMKVKDAATQAAIQSYLTGKTSLQKFQDELLGYGKKLDMVAAREKSGKGWQQWLKEGTATGKDKTDMGSILYAIDGMEEVYGGPIPESVSEIQKDVIYVKPAPDGKGKILVKWNGEQFKTILTVQD